MRIEPLIQGVVARSAHPHGCHASIKEQIEYVKKAPQIKSGPKRVLIIGASSGFGLAARIALTFGGAEADTIGVSFERGPSEKGVGSAGWYNNIFFKQEATHAGRTAINIVGDAFSDSVRNEVIEAIETYFEGEVDLVIYSLAAGVRPKPHSDTFWRSVIKLLVSRLLALPSYLKMINGLKPRSSLPPKRKQKRPLRSWGVKDWESWIDTLINTESVAQGCKTIAFSYMGPEVTHPIYLDGTLGRAKIDLHQTSHALNLKLANFDGGAYATVCKALVTKASVFIPALSPYLLALYRVMKEKGTHERCIEQMQRLFTTKLYDQPKVPVDGERLIRIDDLELDPQTQAEVSHLLEQMNAENFKEIGDYQGFKDEFMKLNGFNFDDVDYSQDISLETLSSLKP